MVFANTYYVATNGNDSNLGTITHPFFTLNQAWKVVSSGDTIFMRGGTYYFQSRQTLTGKDGNAENMIYIWAYPGETPILTKHTSYATSDWPNGLIYLEADYTSWKGIEISGFKQVTPSIWSGLYVINSNHNVFEQINSHHNGHGMVIRDASNDNLILNCDFHHNYDPLSTAPYSNGDGLQISYIPEDLENTVIGCRFWNNSDDGLDLWENDGNMIIKYCWSWSNGYRENGSATGGDGNGLKLGRTAISDGSKFKRIATNCMAFYNRTNGIDQNGANCMMYIYNNIAYQNGNGIIFNSHNLAHIFRNNISLSNLSSDWYGEHTNAIIDHNSYDRRWQPAGPVPSRTEFVSFDTIGVSAVRKPNGSLPEINFLHLAEGSNMINTGVNVGLPYGGNAPDLGPFETQLTSAPNNINIYPNPARGSINISNLVTASESQIIRIFDISGRLCLETRLDNFINTVEIPINLNPGAYCFQVIMGSSPLFTQKLIIVQ